VRKFVWLVGIALAGSFILFAAPTSAQSGSALLANHEQTATGGAIGFAQDQGAGDKAPPANSSESTAAVDRSTAPAQKGRIFASNLGVAVKVSLLGAGVEVATPITFRTHVRVGFNAFSYSRGFSDNGIHYNANLSFRSFETHFDWFPFAGRFHLSPGLVVYNGNQIKANAAVPAGQQFTLGGARYTSDPADPITGTGKIGFNQVGPTFVLGWGNLLPRGHEHFSIPFEFGVLYQGSAKTILHLTGSACDSSGVLCHNITADPIFQSNVMAQQNKLNNDLSFFQVYPVLSLGVGYKF
jgi:hypothetical protein